MNLVVGADSLIGAGLMQRLRRSGRTFLGTTRRPIADSDARLVRLELGNHAEFVLPNASIEVAFLCAGATGFAECAASPKRTRLVNVEATLRLARALLDRGATVVFLSTSAVFSGDVPSPVEEAPYSFATEYGRQKAEAEAAINELRGAEDRVIIVRLTKIQSESGSATAQFVEALRAGRPIKPFSDLNLSPLSLDFVLDGLLHLAMSHQGGIFHLSGESQLSYADLARHIARTNAFDEDLIRPTTTEAAGFRPLYRPRFAGLGMNRTRSLSGIGPESLAHFVDSFKR